MFSPSDGRVSVLLKDTARVRRETVARLLQLVILNIVYFYIAVENLNDNEDMNRASETIKQNIKTSAKESLWLYELKQNENVLNEGITMCLEIKYYNISVRQHNLIIYL